MIVGEDVFSLATGFPNKNKMLSRYFNFYVLSIFSYLSYTTLDHLSRVVSDKFSFIDVREYNISSGSSFVQKITDNSDDGE